MDKMLAEIIPPRILPKVFTTLDLVAIYVLVIMFIPNASAIQGAGAAGFLYWVLAFVTFLIPGAFIVGELGLMFPEEGSIYVWTNKAMGDFWGYFAGWMAWFPGMFVLGLTASLFAAFAQTALGTTFELTTLYGVMLACIWISSLIGLARARMSQNYVNLAFVVYLVGVVIIGFAGIAWLGAGNPPANPINAAGLAPSWGTFWAFGVAILALLGIEVPLNMGVEIVNKKSITKHLLIGSLVLMFLYEFATWGTYMVIPAGTGDVVVAVIQAIQKAISPVLGLAVAAIIAFMMFANTTNYGYAFARLMFVAGIEKRFPLFMGHVNKKTRVPDVAILSQAAIATIILLAMIGAGAVGSFYVILSATITVIWCISMVFLFIDVILVRRKWPERAKAASIIPGGDVGRWIMMILGVASSIIGIYAIYLAPWTPSVSYNDWVSYISVFTIATLVIGAVVYVTSQKRVKAISLERQLELMEVEKLEKGGS